MTRIWTTVIIVICVIAQRSFSAMPEGWICYAAGGSVYRLSLGGSPENLTDNVSAKHACWSYDGSMIFYITNSGDIYAMSSDGSSEPEKIGVADNTSYSSIAAFRPENKSVLVVDNKSFYKIDAVTKQKSLVANAGVSITGEIAISRDGTRIAFRSNDNNNGGKLKKMVVGSGPRGYASYCSASLSPNGEYLLENQQGHRDLKIFNWSSGSVTVTSGSIGMWDNQSFATNSDLWICALDDDPSSGDNSGTGVGIVSRNNEKYSVKTWSGAATQYPRLFIGSLPQVTSIHFSPMTPEQTLHTPSLYKQQLQRFSLDGRILGHLKTRGNNKKPSASSFYILQGNTGKSELVQNLFE